MTREGVGHGGQPRIDLFRQLCRIDFGQQVGRQAFQQRTRQSLGDQAERGVLALILFVGGDCRNQPARLAAQKMLRRRLLHPVPELDEKEIDRAPIDEPDAVRIVEPYRQVAGAGYGRSGARGESGYRCVFRPCFPHQPDLTSL